MPRSHRIRFARAIAKQPIRWGAWVRILRTPDTEAAGLAGLTGQVMGVSTLIAKLPDDCALRVEFGETMPGEFWLSPDLLELMEQGVRLHVEMPQDVLDSLEQTERRSDDAESE
jgi:hypothetical protein